MNGSASPTAHRHLRPGEEDDFVFETSETGVPALESGVPDPDRASPAPAGLAAALLAIGGAAVVLAALPYKTFDLDRFFIPKELVLFAVASLAAVLLLARARRLVFGWADLFLAAFLAISIVSTLFATNHWLAFRALGVSLAGGAVFWSARAISGSRARGLLVSALAAATVLASATALAQAYGWETELVSLNRAPGGTLGNRNFVAHLAAIGIPALLYLALSARTFIALLLSALGIAVSIGALVMSRTRAAWLALAVTVGVLAMLLFSRRRVIGGARATRRMLFVAIVAAIGAGAALSLPNRLNWRSENPYLETAAGLVNYREGSGRGRLIQYRNSVKLVLRNPILGVGPGNWSVAYPRVASPNDPSLGNDGMTSNPWPSSDWVGFLAERGVFGFALLLLAMVTLALGALWRFVRAPTGEEALLALALGGTVLATVLVGAFDAVLLLGAPALIAWGLIGALTGNGSVRWGRAFPDARRRTATLVTAVIGGLLVLRGVGQAVAMATYDASSRTASLERAALLDPGSYRIRIRAAERQLSRGNCKRARLHAQAARDLYPSAPAPKRVLRQCR